MERKLKRSKLEICTKLKVAFYSKSLKKEPLKKNRTGKLKKQVEEEMKAEWI